MYIGNKVVDHYVVADGIYTTALTGVSLQKLEARTTYCTSTHKECQECPQMLEVAKKISQQGFVKFKLASFPSVE